MTVHSIGCGGWIVSRRGSSGTEGSQFALADGVLGVRASLEEQSCASSGVYVAGVFEQTPIQYHERLPGFAEFTDTRVPIVDGMRLVVTVQGEVLGGAATDLASCDWSLDLRGGQVTRTSIWHTPSGRLEIQSERVTPGEPCASIALRYTVRSLDFDGELRIASFLDITNRNIPERGDPRIGANLAGGGLYLAEAGTQDGVTYCVQRTSRSDIWVAAAQANRIQNAMPRGPEESRSLTAMGQPDLAERFVGALTPGDTIVLEKFVTYASGERDPSRKALEDLRAHACGMASRDFEYFARFRRETVGNQWRHSDISIGGDDRCDIALRFNIFHLLQSASRNPQYGTAAKGLIGEGYEGQTFWDSEAFVVPALVFSAPTLARIALQTRISQLDGARATARTLNHRHGALFPWRTIAGRECSAHYPSGSAQYHINAAIAQAIELYVTATGDETLLHEGGAELLWETARIWLDVGTFSPSYDGKFCIFGVTGPDEYSALVDNNFYTNRMAALHLKYAAQVYREMERKQPEAWRQLATRLEIHEEEVASWLAASQAMYLPYDNTLEIDAQDERFLARRRLELDSSRREPLLLTHHPLTLYRHQVSKQADLILAMAFAGDDVPQDRLRRNLAYYESVTTHDSTLSACAYAIVAARSGLPEKALEYFRKAVFVDIDDLHGNVSDGCHMAALGGSVMAVQWGFAGMSWRDAALGFRPRLPSEWDLLTFRMLWRGRLLELAIGRGKARYTLLEGEPLELSHFGVPFLLSASVELDCPPLLDRVA